MSYITFLIRILICALQPFVEFIAFYVIFPGGYIFDYAQWYYIKYFDTSTRQVDEDVDDSKVDWENPRIVGKKRVTSRYRSKYFLQKRDAFDYWKNSNISSSFYNKEIIFPLSGEPGVPSEDINWQFQLVGDPNSCPKGWELTSYFPEPSCEWSVLAVPNHWQLQSFDNPIYSNTSYPFQFDPPRVRRNGKWVNQLCDLGLGGSTEQPGKIHDKEPGENSTGLYRTTFKLPPDWSNEKDLGTERFFLVFEGVDSAMFLWVNGELQGYSQDSCLPAEFDVTDALKSAGGQWWNQEHVIAVKVLRWCDGSYLEDQDKWWISGIYREVYLTKRPSAFIADYEFTSEVKFDKSGDFSCHANISLSVLAEGVQVNSGTASNYTVKVELWNDLADGEPIWSDISEFDAGSVLPNRIPADYAVKNAEEADLEMRKPVAPGVATVRGTIREPHLWSAEAPNLYVLVVSLYANTEDARENRGELHVATERVGIRSVRIGGADNLLCVNEKPILICGMNRTEFNSKTGRGVSAASMREDAMILKKLNFNAVRCAHYPQHPLWLSICDEVGLYVVDEANIETHGFQTLGQPVGYLASLPEWRSAFLSRVTRMFERDKNHPCIIGWSLGNECGHGPAHDEMAKWLRNRDPWRFVQYESGGARTAATDIICPMYLRPSWCLTQSILDPKQRPVILCEYAHAMGNSGGSLRNYWKYFRDGTYPRMQGGFIWDFVDQGLAHPSGNGYAYGGDFGDLPSTQQFCCNGVANPDRVLYATAFEAAYLQAPVHVSLVSDTSKEPILVILNRRTHIDLSDLVIRVTPYFQFPGGDKILKSTSFELLCGAVHPGESKSVNIFTHLISALSNSESMRHGNVLKNTSTKSLDSVLIAAEGWLDISVMHLPETASWHDASVEVLHTAVSSATLLQLMGSVSDLHLDQLSLQFIPQEEPPSSMPEEAGRPQSIITMEEKLEEKEVFVVQWLNGSRVLIGKKCGRMLSWLNEKQRELLLEPVDVCLYRAPTDNDRGGDILSFYAQWCEVGLGSLIRDTQVSCISSVRTLSKGSVELKTSWTLISNDEAKIHVSIPCTGSYTFFPDGSIEVSAAIHPCSFLPPLPRKGLHFALPSHLNRVAWCGLGPHEAYEDRKASAYLGVFEKTVEQLHTPYVFPQECGRRAEPRWIIFENESKDQGLIIIPMPKETEVLEDPINSRLSTKKKLFKDIHPWGFNASKFSIDQMENTKHNHELKEEADGRIHVNVDSRMMGLGGYDSWSPNVDHDVLVFPPKGEQVLETCVRMKRF